MRFRNFRQVTRCTATVVPRYRRAALDRRWRSAGQWQTALAIVGDLSALYDLNALALLVRFPRRWY